MNRLSSYILFLFFTISACGRVSESNGPKYSATPANDTIQIFHFAVHPLHNPTMLLQTYQPLIDYLNKNLTGAKIILEASKDYATFEQKFYNRKPGFILPNPWQTMQAIKAGYHVIAMAGDPADFKGIFIVRKDGGIHEPVDLKGKTVSYPSPTALAACIMPQDFLYRHGIDVNNDIINAYVGSQESSIMNVYLKKSSCGVTWPTPWRAFQRNHPQEASELKVIWETEPMINNSVMVRDDVPLNIREFVIEKLVVMHNTEQGMKILNEIETKRFYNANNADYEIVQHFIDRFEKEIRKVKTDN
ncbi:MAG: PhnD/SsuA/transferrin family substrate-binding protein [Bacteroidales bacterium]|nr:PhnD/SsuA/transferrin family substrate-binding protein [Bacteroidales bacterium]